MLVWNHIFIIIKFNATIILSYHDSYSMYSGINNATIESGILYVKELFDGNCFKEIEMFRNLLRYKANWICEYNILKRVFNRYCEIFDTTRSKYIDIKENTYFLFPGNICNI